MSNEPVVRPNEIDPAGSVLEERVTGTSPTAHASFDPAANRTAGNPDSPEFRASHATPAPIPFIDLTSIGEHNSDMASIPRRQSGRLAEVASTRATDSNLLSTSSTLCLVDKPTGTNGSGGKDKSGQSGAGKTSARASKGGGGSKSSAAQVKATTKRKRQETPEPVLGSSEDEEEYDIERVVNHVGDFL